MTTYFWESCMNNNYFRSKAIKNIVWSANGILPKNVKRFLRLSNSERDLDFTLQIFFRCVCQFIFIFQGNKKGNVKNLRILSYLFVLHSRSWMARKNTIRNKWICSSDMVLLHFYSSCKRNFFYYKINNNKTHTHLKLWP